MIETTDREPKPWQDQLFELLKGSDIRQVAYVPDAGHSRLIARCKADPDILDVVLTTEEEGVALAAGHWLGGGRSALAMQSSGVGNCINMLSLTATLRAPLLCLVTMRGEWGEFNPWQVPMGRATPAVLEALGLAVHRVELADEVRETVDAAAKLAFGGHQAVAVLLSQRLLGTKAFK